MNVIYYINYKIYNRFLKQDSADSSAYWTTVMTVPLLFFLNIATLLNILCIFISKKPMLILGDNIKPKLLYIYFSIVIINYLLVYLNSRYIKLFSVIRRIEVSDFYYYSVSFLYPFGSYVLLIITFLILSYQENGYIKWTL